MGNSQNDFHDSYHDDPIEPVAPQRKKTSVLAALVLFAVGGFYLQSTLAANLSINSKTALEFGQAITQTVSCAGTPVDLTITPQSTFVNASGSGSHYFKSVTVSNIPSPGCDGVDFTISAYNDTSSTSLALFNTSSTSAVVYDKAGTFSRGLGSAGITVESSTGTFTATFTTPVAQSSNVFKLTIQSGAHTPYYDVGWTGPGGGLIYYVNDAGFNCGATFSATGSPTGGKCKYLEVAPSGWSGASDPAKGWSTGISGYGNASADVDGIADDASVYNNILAVGLGYRNSVAIVLQNGVYPTNDYAAGAARAYAGGSKSDWYLPTTAELNLLCQWDQGVAPSVTIACTGGTPNSSTYGASSAGFAANYYWSSSEGGTNWAWYQYFTTGGQSLNNGKATTNLVRPIRAF